MSNKGKRLVQVDTNNYQRMLKKVFAHDSNIMEVRTVAEMEGAKRVARNLTMSLHNCMHEARAELEELLHTVEETLPKIAHDMKPQADELLMAKQAYYEEAKMKARPIMAKIDAAAHDVLQKKEILEKEGIPALEKFEAEQHPELRELFMGFANRGRDYLSTAFLKYWADHDRVRPVV
jgi:ElaB/YqjD/DUF883 family membrane-anchored ribosome-binding protein